MLTSHYNKINDVLISHKERGVREIVLFENIKRIRKARNLTQDEVAEACGVDRATISKWETGEFSPRVDKLVKLANILGCTVDELLEEK